MKTKIDPKLHIQLLDIARESDTTYSDILNELLRKYIEKYRVMAAIPVIEGNIIKDFFSKYIIVDGASSVDSLDLYKIYKYWSESNGYNILPRISFTKSIIHFTKNDNNISYLDREHSGVHSKFTGIRLIELKLWQAPI